MMNKEQADEAMKNVIIIFDVVNYLNQRTDRYFRAKKATAKLIIDKLLMGYSKEDFFNVIDLKIKEWTGEYEKYIRPETLFGDNFELYYRELNK